MCYLSNDTLTDELRRTGVLLQSPAAFDGKVFYCRHGLRHWVRNAVWIKNCGFRWPDDVINVPPAVISAFRPSGSIGQFWSENCDPDTINSSIDMREFAASGLVGAGMEIGAGASPFPTPLTCKVTYGDVLDYGELIKETYDGQDISDIVIPDLCTDFDTFTGVLDESLDFVIGCHVIEHTRNPIGAIENAWQKLRKGGKLVLVIPDKERTFDCNRSTTSLDHLIEDYSNPDLGRDISHYQEFYKLAFPTPDDQFADVVSEKFAEQYSIHFHVWNYTAFSKMIKYVCNNIVSWSNVWSHSTLDDREHDIEFYFVLTK